MSDRNEMNFWPIIPSDPPQSIPIYDATMGGSYRETLTTNPAVGGTNNQSSSTVPAGEIWIVESICSFNNTSATTLHYFGIQDATSFYRVKMALALAAQVALEHYCCLHLYAGDYIKAVFQGCTAGDLLLTYINGYKLNI